MLPKRIFTRYSIKAKISLNGEVIGKSLDISLGGMKIISHKGKLLENKKLYPITINFPHSQNTITLPCKYMWQKTTTKERTFIGFRFNYDNIASIINLTNFIITYNKKKVNTKNFLMLLMFVITTTGLLINSTYFPNTTEHYFNWSIFSILAISLMGFTYFFSKKSKKFDNSLINDINFALAEQLNKSDTPKAVEDQISQDVKELMLVHGIRKNISELIVGFDHNKEVPTKLNFDSEELELLKQFPQRIEQIELLIMSLHQTVTALKISMSNIKNTSDKIYNIAKEMVNNSDQAFDDLQMIYEAMNKAQASTERSVEQSNKLSTFSRSIDSILSTITDLAAKINILSYNAAIVSSKAGSHGKAFKIVSDEIRALGTQTTSEIGKIKHIIGNIQNNIGSLFSLVNESKQELLNSNSVIKNTIGNIQGIMLSIELVHSTSQDISDEIINQEDDMTSLYVSVQDVVELFRNDVNINNINKILNDIEDVTTNFNKYKSKMDEMLKKINVKANQQT